MLTAKGMRFPIDLIWVCILWQAAYPLIFRHLEAMTEKCGVFVDHSSINRWAIRFLPLFEKVFRKHKRQVGCGWGMDQTCIKVKGDWKYLYRAVNKAGRAVDFLLTTKRDKAAAQRFFDKAMKGRSVPEKGHDGEERSSAYPFKHWQEKSALLEGLALVPVKITFING